MPIGISKNNKHSNPAIMNMKYQLVMNSQKSTMHLRRGSDQNNRDNGNAIQEGPFSE
jgi:hypothetical protein